MASNYTSEQYARARLLNSPLHSFFYQNKNKQEEVKTVPTLDSTAYKNVQSVIAQLFIMISVDTAVPLKLIADTIKSEADSIAAAGLSYAHNIIEANEELEVEYEEEDPEKGDWKDREEEEDATDQTRDSKSLN